MRKCRNWQTSKTKDLVAVMSCGFKSHLPHSAEVAELADAQASGACGSNIVWVQVPSPAWFENLGSLDFTGLPVFYVIIFDGTFGTNRTNLMKEPY